MNVHKIKFSKPLFLLKCFLLTVIFCLTFFVNGGESRVRPRIQSYGKVYTKDILKIETTPSTSSKEISSVSSILKEKCTDSEPFSEQGCTLLSPLSFKQYLSQNDSTPPKEAKSRLCPQSEKKYPVNSTCGVFIHCLNNSITLNKCTKSSHYDPVLEICKYSLERCSLTVPVDVDFITSLALTVKGILSPEKKALYVNQIESYDRARKPKTIETVEEQTERESHEKIAVSLSTTTKPVMTKENATLNNKTNRSTQPSVSRDGTNANNSRSHSYRKEPKALAGIEEATLLESESTHPEGVKVSFCSALDSGIIPDPRSCQFFIQCSFGREYVQKCAPGTVFNPMTSVCDWEANVPHCSKENNKSDFSDHRVKRSLVVANRAGFVNSKLLIPPLQTNQQNQHAKRENAQTLSLYKKELPVPNQKGNGSRKCSLLQQEEYIHPHETQCNKFEICSNGKIVEQTCGRGTLFNPLSSVCDLPHNVDCGSRKIDFSTYECHQELKYRTSHPESCEKFIECDNGDLHIKSCPPTTRYDWEEDRCDHAFKIKCRKPISLEHDTDINYIQKRLARSVNLRNKLNLACEFNYIAPHPRFCNQFVECENRVIFIKSCGPGTVFNGEIGQCDWAYNTKKPDLENCRRYLLCERGVYRSKQCPRNTIYNPRTKNCVFFQYEAELEFCRNADEIVTPQPA